MRIISETENVAEFSLTKTNSDKERSSTLQNQFCIHCVYHIETANQQGVYLYAFPLELQNAFIFEYLS